ncbi:MAG: hypothetical protein HYT72_05755 [Candidatus Aenigmarchaeota archaeon]|nr:hypothetical protein [Candidatus Aenigmarchaeota archaeon]
MKIRKRINRILQKGNERNKPTHRCASMCSRETVGFYSRGMSPIFEAVFIILIFVIAVTVVLNIGLPSVDFAKAANTFGEAQNMMKLIDNNIREVVREGPAAKRLVRSVSPGEFEVVPAEDSIQFKMNNLKLVEYLSRKVAGNLVQIGGSDVSCSDAGNLTLENSYLRIDLQKIPQTSPLSALNTNTSILAIKEKNFNTAVTIVNSSIVMNGNASTSNGTGYSEILRKGRDLPVCVAHFFVNSTVTYDVYYSLYAGADFFVMDVRNVK